MVALEVWWAVAVAGGGLGAWAFVDVTEPGRRLRRARRLLALAEQVPEQGLQTDLRVAADYHLSRPIRPGRRARLNVSGTIAVVLTGMLLAAPFWIHVPADPPHGWAAGMWTAVLAAYGLEVPAAWGYLAWLTR